MNAKALERLAKLHELAKKTENPHEAENARQRILAVMAMSGVSRAELDEHLADMADDIASAGDVSENPHTRQLAFIVAFSQGCKCGWRPRQRDLVFAGPRRKAIQARDTFLAISVKIQRDAIMSWQHNGGYRGEFAALWFNVFSLCAVEEITAKIMRNNRRTERTTGLPSMRPEDEAGIVNEVVQHVSALSDKLVGQLCGKTSLSHAIDMTQRAKLVAAQLGRNSGHGIPIEERRMLPPCVTCETSKRAVEDLQAARIRILQKETERLCEENYAMSRQLRAVKTKLNAWEAREKELLRREAELSRATPAEETKPQPFSILEVD